MNTTKTTCPYCGVGCGVLATVKTDGSIAVQGDPDHPANFGRLCSKGAALAETLGLEGRLLAPVVNGNKAEWDEALDTVASRFQRVIDEHGPDAVAFYVSGQLLTEDYYVANKLMKGFIGSANIDTNSRLCMSSSVAGHKRAFGADAVPCSYEDLERAKLLLLVGSNTAWCHPVLYQRMVKAKQDNPDLMVVVIDPRATATADIADIHLGLKPGTDTILFNGLLSYLAEQGEGNPLYIKEYTEGMEAALDSARLVAPDIATVARRCGLAESDVEWFYRLFGRTERVVSVYSQGVNQSSFGTDKVNSIINCHLYTGRIGRPGMGPFSFTGQPNAMGGREVGGLANQLAAHMDIGNPEHRDLVQRFWQSPLIADHDGLKAVELFQAIRAGKVKALWVMATNPAVSLPDADGVREALQQCEFVVVSDVVAQNDTSRYAHVMLPALAWGEKDGTVTNSERRISRQRAFLPAPGEARADWWIISEVARRMGHGEAFAYTGPAAIFAEHAALSGYENNGRRDFDISSYQDLNADDYEHLHPKQWPLPASCPEGNKRLFGDGCFYTDSGRARFIAVGERTPVYGTERKYPLVLNTGRIRDQWHTMTRTGKTPRLFQHSPEPYAEIHPDDAACFGVEDGGLVELTSKWGQMVLRARSSAAQQVGSVFVPMHWNDQFALHAHADALVNNATDPVSGQPEFKFTPLRIAPHRPAWQGFVLSRRRLSLQSLPLSYRAEVPLAGLWRYELAGLQASPDWAAFARELLCGEGSGIEWVEYFDASATRYRGARIQDSRLESCIFIGPNQHLPGRDALAGLFSQASLSDGARYALLSGRAVENSPQPSRNVCACFCVSEQQILEVIHTQGLTSVEAVGRLLQAGTNCGSCLPEIKRLLQTAQQSVDMAISHAG